uniref:Seed maturation protein n=1 Tax=Bursaphelenchus xylophilus TaxID=6326 RepID=A0A1I7SG47_BURXY
MSFRRPKNHSDKANEPQSRSNFHGASGNAPQSQAEIKSVAHGSTPNLMAESMKPLVARDLRYDRPTMMAIKESVEGVAADGKLMEKAAQLNASAQPNDLSDSNAD